MATATLTAPSLADHVALLLADPILAVTVTAAPQGSAFVYVTGADLDSAAALLGADPALLLTRCYTQGGMALVVSVWTPDSFPLVAPAPRPVCPPVSDCPTTNDLWGNLLLSASYTGPDRRARQRTDRDHWFAWCARGLVDWGEK